MNTSLRVKLIISFCIIVFLMVMAAAVISVHLIGEWTLRQTRERLDANISSAREVYTDRIVELQTILAFTALRPKTVKGALIAGDTHTLLLALQEVRNVSGMDILSVTDASGKVILRAHHPDLSGDSMLDDILVARVVKTGNPVNGTVLVPCSKLALESADLAERVTLPSGSPNAPSSRDISGINAGMMIEAAVPIVGDDKRMIGILVGGRLLNGDHTIIARVKNVVFVNDLHVGKEVSTVSVYQGTLCIAASTAAGRGAPLIGTRVTQDILDSSQTHPYPIIRRTVMADERHIAVYEAIRTPDGKAIGLLSVGMYESALLDFRKRQAIIIVGVIVFSMFFALAAWFILSKRIVRPIRELASRAQQMVEGSPDF